MKKNNTPLIFKDIRFWLLVISILLIGYMSLEDIDINAVVRPLHS